MPINLSAPFATFAAMLHQHFLPWLSNNACGNPCRRCQGQTSAGACRCVCVALQAQTHPFVDATQDTSDADNIHVCANCGRWVQSVQTSASTTTPPPPPPQAAHGIDGCCHSCNHMLPICHVCAVFADAQIQQHNLIDTCTMVEVD